MAIGVVGRKVGMTRVFGEDGVSTPVTVVEVQPNCVTRVCTVDKEGYSSIQVTTGEKKTSRINQPEMGHFAKVGVSAGRGLWEFRLDDHSGDTPEVGSQITADLFQVGQKIDVRGVSKGKGFQGGVKRHNFHMQDATHGNSLSHRAPGSIGQCQTPGRVFKGKKMPGHMGAEKVCTQNLEITRVDVERNLLLLKGAVPGAPGGDVIITPATKMKNK